MAFFARSRPHRWLSYNQFVRTISHSHSLPSLQKTKPMMDDDNNSGSDSHSKTWNRDWINYLLASSIGIGLGLRALHKKQKNIRACGIMAMVSHDEDVSDALMDGLLILQNRGYDSAGVATLTSTDKDHAELKISKHASKGSTSDSLDLLGHEIPEHHRGHHIGIAHTRWATHGAKTDENAHPHMDWKGRIAIVHNGTIENCEEVRQVLMKKGVTFHSQTDTEVIANLVGFYLDEGHGEEDALKCALNELDGSWGIAMVAKNRPNEIFGARNGSPLMIGLNGSRNFLASEHTAFSRYTNQYIPLKDGEIVVVKADGISLDKTRQLEAPYEHIPLSPDPYPHWTLKEMMEQPAAVSRSLSYGSRLDIDNQVKLGGLEKNEELLSSIRHMVITGCGTSYHAGLYAQRMMQYLNSFETVAVVDAAEVISDSFPAANAGLLAISQSGETKDVLNTLAVAEQLSIPRLSVVNSVGSAISRETGLGVYTYAGREHAVASTKAFITQVTVLALVAGWFAKRRSEEMNARKDAPLEVVDDKRRADLVDSLHRLPTYTGLTLGCRAQCQRIAEEMKDSNHVFVLGKGFAEPIAYEGALKIKEITYIHAEGYSGGALKHGPFALIEEGTPVIMIILNDAHRKTLITNAHEIASRGGKITFITDRPEMLSSLKGEKIKIPSNGPLTALLAVIPLQFLAYELSVLRGIDPDKPKNLAKAVTVD